MKTKHPFILASCILLFFMWGLITVLNDILVPHLKSLFTLTYVQAMLVQFCFFTAYGLMSLPSGRIVEKYGYKKTLLLGLFIASIGCLFFLPAASFGLYFLFLIGLFILATGIVILQVSANPYVALLGTEKTASSRLNLAQGFNSLGTTIGPIIGSSLILSVLKGSKNVSGIESLYFCLSILFFLLCIFIALVKFPNLKKEKYDLFQEDLSKQAAAKENIRPIFKHPHLYLGALAVFCYVGAEVSIGSFLVSFLSQKSVFNIEPYIAGNYVSFYWGLSMIGRFLGFFLLLKVRSRKALFFAALC